MVAAFFCYSIASTTSFVYHYGIVEVAYLHYSSVVDTCIFFGAVCNIIQYNGSLKKPAWPKSFVMTSAFTAHRIYSQIS